jgi:SAM-dependent methyltransferase
MTAAFADHFSGHAPDYRTYRPSYPPELFAFLRSLVPHGERVWDCGTGNGQAAVALADHFPAVFATDASAEQIALADPHPHVTYAVAPAEGCPLTDASVDLVTAAQALHWFRFDEFYAEVRRVCRPGGVIAAWGYAFHRVSPAVDAVLMRLEREFVGPYWPPERRFPEERYATLPFPFAPIDAPPLTITARWNLDESLGYLNTWSATKRFTAAHGFNPVERLEAAFAAVWSDPFEYRTVTWDLFLRVGRVN